MAKPLHHSSDIPRFDSYPSGPELANEPERLLTDKTESSPTDSTDSSSLHNYGAQLGSAAGMAVVALRRAQERVAGMATEKKATITDIASARLRRAREVASVRGREWSQTLRENSVEWRRQARNATYRARLRLRQIEHDNPLHVVAVAGAVGVTIGAVLRIWRANRA